MFRIRIVSLFAAFCAASPALLPHASAQVVAESGVVLPPYAAVADLIVGAPAIVDARIRSATRIKGPEAANVAAGRMRFYVEADVLALIRADAPMPARVGYVVDVPLDARGRAPKLNKRRVLLFARPVAGQASMIQLTTLDAQRDWSAELDTLIRRIAREVAAPDAPPAVTGLGNAFHVPGSLPGEGETQIFVQTATGAPISLSILRRPGEQKRWAVALGEIVDDAAAAPARDTLLWYRLACGLPRSLPATSLADEDPANVAAAREDYRFVLDQLGPCKR
ncbi:hypothetical protein LRS12_04060 [Sphingomonas sp. J344]|uniref:hypothetical protein n=1 Tax=Sphingomonas sp. J344 TaxID=2898434 RepID=UPI002151E7CA|nr:hypothetical protein [Sphingomonas sp. J344]MCR5869988.1 hypothetical protein [Sphingomonas sp. J344]